MSNQNKMHMAKYLPQPTHPSLSPGSDPMPDFCVGKHTVGRKDAVSITLHARAPWNCTVKIPWHYALSARPGIIPHARALELYSKNSMALCSERAPWHYTARARPGIVQ